MIIIEILKIVITPITLALISTLCSFPILNLVEQFKRRKLKIYVESLSLLEKLDDDFHEEFINPNLKEQGSRVSAFQSGESILLVFAMRFYRLLVFL